VRESIRPLVKPLPIVALAGAVAAAGYLAGHFVQSRASSPRDAVPEPSDVKEQLLLKSITAQYSCPAYAGLPDRQEQSGRVVGLEGTRVRLTFESSLPLRRAILSLVLEGEALPPRSLRFTNRTTFEAQFILKRNGRYRVELLPESQMYDISVMRDWPPEVDVTSPGRDLVLTRRAMVEVPFRARDDFGLASVVLVFRVKDGKPITLPLGNSSPGFPTRRKYVAETFWWDLATMSDLPDEGTLTYFVRARDRNPAGQEVRSRRYTIRLIKPLEFHIGEFERSRRLLAEARTAYLAQRGAWSAARAWSDEGERKEDDKGWKKRTEEQDKALRAAWAARRCLGGLITACRRNRMTDEFMAARVVAADRDLRLLEDNHMAAVQRRLRRAQPRTDADAAPAALQAARAAALAETADARKLAVLRAGRALGRLRDWRDLQAAYLRVRRLSDDQQRLSGRINEEMIRRLKEGAASGRSDKDTTVLAALREMQRQLLHAETRLERDFRFMISEARREQRTPVVAPLSAALQRLRDKSLTDRMNRSVGLIEADLLGIAMAEHRKAAAALDAVARRLLVAGSQVVKYPELTPETRIEDVIPPERPVRRRP